MVVAAYGQVNLTEYPKGARTIERYEKLEQIGEGTYGSVLVLLLINLLFHSTRY